MVQHGHATAICMWCVYMCHRTLGDILGLAQHAEEKVVIFKFVQVFPSNYFFSYMKKLLLCLNDEGFMQLSFHGGGDQKEEHSQPLVHTQLLPSLGSGFLSVFCRTLVCSRCINRHTHLASGPPAVHKDKMKGTNEPHCILCGMLVGLGVGRTIL